MIAPSGALWAARDRRAIVTVAKPNPTDGTRMVAALASRELGRQVDRKRAQHVMREQRLLPAFVDT